MNHATLNDHLKKGETGWRAEIHKRTQYSQAMLDKIVLEEISREYNPGSQVVNDAYTVAELWKDRYDRTGKTAMVNPRRMLQDALGWSKDRAKKAWERFARWFHINLRENRAIYRLARKVFRWVFFVGDPMKTTFLKPQDLPLYAAEIADRLRKAAAVAKAWVFKKRFKRFHFEGMNPLTSSVERVYVSPDDVLSVEGDVDHLLANVIGLVNWRER